MLVDGLATYYQKVSAPTIEHAIEIWSARHRAFKRDMQPQDKPRAHELGVDEQVSGMYQTGGDESLGAYVSRLWWCLPLQDNVPFSSTDTGEFPVN